MWHRPMSAKELEEHLFKWNDTIRHISLYLNQSPKVEQTSNGRFCLRENQSLNGQKINDENRASELWRKVKKVRWLFQLIPNIRMVAVCNTLAINHAEETSDIDLFVVTKKNRMFTTRFILTAILHLVRQRRHGSKIKGRFCLSLFVDESYLNLGSLQLLPYDIYLAYWIKTLQPLIGKKTYVNFLEINRKWLSRYFEKNIDPQEKNMMGKWNGFILRVFQFLGELLINNPLGDKIEKTLARWQIARAKRKKEALNEGNANIIIKKNILKFHNIDRRKEYRALWEEKLRSLGLLRE